MTMPPSFLPRTHIRALVGLKSLLSCCMLIALWSSLASAQQTHPLEILEPEIQAGTVFVAPGVLDLRFTVSPDVKFVRIIVTTDDDSSKTTITVDPEIRQYSPTINLLKGKNRIELFAFKAGQDKPIHRELLFVTCTGKKCGAETEPSGGTGMSAGGTGGGGSGQQTPPKPANVTILQPSGPTTSSGLINSVIAVKKSDLDTLLLLVINDGNPVEQPTSKLPVRFTDEVAILTPKIRLKKGQNTITLLNVDNPLDRQAQATVTVTCTGEKCDTPVPSEPITINLPEGGTQLQDAEYVNSEITVKKDSKITKLFVRVLNNGKPLANPLEESGAADRQSIPLTFESDKDHVVTKPRIKVGKGTNLITVFDADKAFEVSPQASTQVTCVGDKCGGAAVTAKTGAIEIGLPGDGKATFVDATYIQPKVKIKDKKITHLYLRVLNNGKVVRQPEEKVDVHEGDNNVKIKIEAGENEVKVFDADVTDNPEQATVVVKCEGEKCGKASDIENNPTAFTRAIVGLEQAAAASTDPEQKLFLEFNLSAPLFKRNTTPIQAPLWLWLNPRITSLPQQITGSVAEFSTAANFFSPFTSGKVNDIVQAFEFNGGFEFPIRLNGSRVTAPIASGFGPNTKVRFGLSPIVGAGILTPFSTQKVVQVFKVNQTVIDRFPGAKDKEFIAFVPPDRNRFFRRYFAGLRLKTYYVRDDFPDELDTIFPGIIDITVGQNESVTGGALRGVVFGVEGIYPLPFIKGKQRGSLYVFGSARVKLNDAKIETPVFLQPPDSPVAVPGDKVFIQQLPPRDSDYYRLGIGVDLIRLIKRNDN